VHGTIVAALGVLQQDDQQKAITDVTVLSTSCQVSTLPKTKINGIRSGDLEQLRRCRSAAPA
jgi:hypothetical protein